MKSLAERLSECLSDTTQSLVAKAADAYLGYCRASYEKLHPVRDVEKRNEIGMRIRRLEVRMELFIRTGAIHTLI